MAIGTPILVGRSASEAIPLGRWIDGMVIALQECEE
jgi:hypothetical protein